MEQQRGQRRSRVPDAAESGDEADFETENGFVPGNRKSRIEQLLRNGTRRRESSRQFPSAGPVALARGGGTLPAGGGMTSHRISSASSGSMADLPRNAASSSALVGKFFAKKEQPLDGVDFGIVTGSPRPDERDRAQSRLGQQQLLAAVPLRKGCRWRG